jgi:hypothetical protein
MSSVGLARVQDLLNFSVAGEGRRLLERISLEKLQLKLVESKILNQDVLRFVT